MRFILAIVSFLLAAVMIGSGFAQRTVLAGPDNVTVESTVAREAPVTVVDGSALGSRPGAQTLAVEGSDRIFAAYGRTSDVLGWVGDAQYNLITLDADTGELVTEFINGDEEEVPDPAGSDLWLSSYDQEDSLRMTISAPEDVSVILTADGVEPAPGTVSVSWGVDNRTPWSGPLLTGGAIVLLIGLVLLVWALIHHRRSGGPRRKQPKMPKVPKRTTSRKAMGQRRAIRPLLAAGGLTAVLALSACTTTGMSANVTATPTPTSTAPVAEVVPPGVTERQVERILADVAEVAAAADASLDATALESRFTGAALELRSAHYAIRTADGNVPALPEIPGSPVAVTLPQKTDTWPRTVFTVVQNPNDATVPNVAMFLVQESARENYRVEYAVTLEPSAQLPDVAAATVGTARLSLDNPLLANTPEQIALAYADILAVDTASESYDMFEAEGDTLRVAVGLEAKEAARAAFPTTASMTFTNAMGPETPIAMATVDAGALVAVSLHEITTVAPIEAGAAVNTTGSVLALSGVAVSTKGVVATYGDQLLFYVPPVGDDSPIVLLGYAQGLISAVELP